jgi:hypothetical protein
MNFLEPWGLLGLAALAPVIALYFLKLKREERVVPSTLLWKKVLDDLQVNAPFQRLKYSLLLLLQLLLVSLLGFAMARPYLSLSGYAGQKIILLIDTSASMGTRDAGPNKSLTRLEAAVRDAITKADDLRDNDEMLIVAFDKDVRQLCKFINDRSILKQLLNSLEPRDVETKANEAFETALALAQDKTNAQVIVLSDGCFGDVKLFKETEAAGGNTEDQSRQNTRRNVHLDLSIFRFKSYGEETSDNVGITQMDARTRPVKATDANGQRVDTMETTLFIMVENFSPKDREVTLRISAQDNSFPVKLESVSLKGRQSRVETLESQPGGATTDESARSVLPYKLPLGTTGIVTAQIVAPKDKFPTDDSASIVLGTSGTIKLLWVSKGNVILDKALSSIKGLDETKMDPDDFLKQYDQKGQALLEPYDACIFEGASPVAWTDGGALFIGAVPPIGGFAQNEELYRKTKKLPDNEKLPEKKDQLFDWPALIDWDTSHPAMRYVNFGNVTIKTGQAWKAPNNSKILVEGSIGPLAVAYETDRVRVIGVAFDILSSDWAYRPSLPLFLRNVIPWIAESSPRRRPACQHTGDPLFVPPNAKWKSTKVQRPDGSPPEHVELSTEHATYVKGTEKSGLYWLKELTDEPDGRAYAVNLASRNESDNAARASLRVEDVTMNSAPTAIDAKREIWNTLALIAAGILLIEWWVYHRRVGF